MIELRVRTKIPAEEMAAKEQKLLSDADYNVVLTGPTRVLRPDGKPLCVYLPGAISPELRAQAWPILHSLKNSYTSNRGMASGSKKIHPNDDKSRRNYGINVDSAIAGSYRENTGPKAGLCRLTAWTGKEFPAWQELWPLFEAIAAALQEHVPERYRAQAREAQQTAPEWVIPGTPFTTITINNTWATAVHQDKGDLDAGFSTLACFRQGDYAGGLLTFPEYRVAVDMQDRDLLLMDAHDWHGNTPLLPEPERDPNGKLVRDPGYERISVVSYFRTSMVKCGSASDEAERARIKAENRHAALLGE